MDDLSLLKLFTQERDEAAFTKLVGRHLGMVYGVVYRRTGSRELAEELTQNVFTALARKADFNFLGGEPPRLVASRRCL